MKKPTQRGAALLERRHAAARCMHTCPLKAGRGRSLSYPRTSPAMRTRHCTPNTCDARRCVRRGVEVVETHGSARALQPRCATCHHCRRALYVMTVVIHGLCAGALRLMQMPGRRQQGGRQIQCGQNQTGRLAARPCSCTCMRRRTCRLLF